jgi:hypothetical protein
MRDQNDVEDDRRLKSNKRGKELNNSRAQIKQEIGDTEQTSKSAHSDRAPNDCPASRVPDAGVQNRAEKAGASGGKMNAKLKQEFKNGNLVWHRIKGFPWWPGLVVDESDLPENIKKVNFAPFEDTEDIRKDVVCFATHLIKII